MASEQHRDPKQRNAEPFTETLAALVGLRDQESGDEEPEVDQDPVRFDDTQLDRARPKGREGGEERK